jgi:hypothetical protein
MAVIGYWGVVAEHDMGGEFVRSRGCIGIVMVWLRKG